MNNIFIKLKTKLGSLNKQSVDVMINVFCVFLIQGGSMLMALFTMPSYMRYFNNELILGCWFTLLSIINWVLTFDLGIGNGLRNQLTVALATGDNEEAKKLISSSYVAITFFISFLAVLLWFYLPYVNLNSLFNISTEVINHATLLVSVGIIFIGISLRFIFQLISSVLYALQKSALVNFLTFITNLFILCYILIAPSRDIATNLITLSLVHVLAADLPLLIVTIVIFSKKLKECKPNIKYYSNKYAKKILSIGVAFFVLQIAYMFVGALNEFLISYMTTPINVTEYQAYYKLFSTISSVFLLALTPLWSSVTKAQAQNNFTWVIKTYRLFATLAIFISLLQLLFLPMLQFVFNIWLGKDIINVSYKIAFIFAISNCVLIWHNFNSTMANGLGYLKPQFIFLTLAAVLKIPVSFILVKLTGDWSMIVLSTAIVLIPLTIAQPIMLTRYLKNKKVK